MASDLLSQFSQQYGNTANWNALRGGKDPLIQQFAQQYGANSNWNSFRPAGAASQTQEGPLSTAPATLPQPQEKEKLPSGPGGYPAPALAMAPQGRRDEGGDQPPAPPPPAPPAPPPQPPATTPPAPTPPAPTPPAPPPNHPPLPPGWAVGSDGNPGYYRSDGGWQSVSWNDVPGGSGATGGGGGGGSGGNNPAAGSGQWAFPATGSNIPLKPDGKTPFTYDEYVKYLTDYQSKLPEDQRWTADKIKSTADAEYQRSLEYAIQQADQLAYGGANKHSDANYWMDMWKKDPAYTWERLLGRGAGGSDKAQAGPWAGGDPNAEGGSGVKNATQYTLGDPLKSPLLAPWEKEFNYADFSSSAKYTPPDPFKPPTEEDMLKDPGYLARLHEGQRGLQNAASARGTLGTGGTLKDLMQFSQDYAANEYSDVYSRGLNEYLTSYNANLQNFQTLYGTDLNNWLTNYNKALGEYQQQYNIFEQNQAKQYNRIANLAGLGQVAAGNLSSAGMNFAGNAGSLLMQRAGGLANYYTQAANARAAQQAGSGALLGGLFGNLGNIFG